MHSEQRIKTITDLNDIGIRLARGIIIPFFDSFLQGAAALTAADKNALHKRVLELGKYLGGEFEEKAGRFYTGKSL